MLAEPNGAGRAATGVLVEAGAGSAVGAVGTAGSDASVTGGAAGAADTL
jgi:hypothetical protein